MKTATDIQFKIISQEPLVFAQFSDEVKLETEVVSGVGQVGKNGKFGVSKIIPQNLIIKLNQPGGKVKLVILVIGKDQEFYKLKTICQHLSRDTEAEITVKAVMFDQSELDYLGNILVGEDGHGTKTSLRCQTLLLSKEARAKTIPSLEIIANDVKAGHSASVGRVDDELLFYLETRGFDRETAVRLLIEGFLREILEGLSEQESEQIWLQITQKLPFKI